MRRLGEPEEDRYGTDSNSTEDRQGRSGHRTGHRHRVPRRTARDLQRRPHRVRGRPRRREDRRRRRGRAAPRREPRAHRRDEADRRHDARHDAPSTRARRSRCRSVPRRSAACSTCSASRWTIPIGPVQSKERWPIHRHGADARAAVDRAADVRDRHQGHRPARAVSAGRQDRPVRRRRRRQDRHHHGADQQHRHEARRCVGVRRCRRTHARRQRPVARVPGVGRHRRQRPVEVARRAGLRPDDGAARRAPARRPVGADRGRVLPRRGRQGRAAVHRQHLPLHAGGLGSVGAARPHAVGRRLPADAAHGDGRDAGAHHVDEEGLDHVGAGDLRARRRLHRSRRRRRPSRTSTRRRTCRGRSPSSASIRRSIRWRRRRAFSIRASSARSTTTSPGR